MLMNILEALFFFVIGWMVGGYFVLSALNNIIQKHRITQVPESSKLNVEVHNDIYYVFDTTSNSFVCQGKTLEETFENLQSRGVNTAIISFNERKFVFRQGLVVELGK